MPKRIVDNANVTVDSSVDELLAKLHNIIPKILTEWGMLGEREAKKRCAVDTGRLHNSITWAISGQPAAISSYSGDRAGKDGRPPQSGKYSGTAPDDPSNKLSVYIGTNVKYGKFVEFGSSRYKNTGPRPYLKPAITDNIGEFKKILQDYLDSLTY